MILPALARALGTSRQKPSLSLLQTSASRRACPNVTVWSRGGTPLLDTALCAGHMFPYGQAQQYSKHVFDKLERPNETPISNLRT